MSWKVLGTSGALSLLLSPLALAQVIDFDPAANYDAGTQPDTSVVADFNGDGFPDLATTSEAPDKIRIRMNNGDGTLGAFIDVATGNATSPSALTAIDVDGDKDFDLAVALKQLSEVRIALNDGGIFTLGGSGFAVEAEPVHMRAAQLNTDGAMDLAVSNRDGNTVTVLLNNGSGSFSSNSYNAGEEPREIATGDLDKDGDIDIAAAAHRARAIQILLNSGTGTFSPGPFLPVGSDLRPEGMAASDLDQDGDADLIASTSGDATNFLSVWKQTTAGVFSGPVNYLTGGVEPNSVDTADYDLDGDVDLSTVNRVSGTMSVLANSGSGTFGSPVIFAAGLSPDHLTGGDLNQDGSVDLVATNRDSNNVSVFINGNSDSWIDLGFGLAGTNGIPVLDGTGILSAGFIVSLDVTNGLANAPAVLFVGLDAQFAPLRGGVLVPTVDFFALMFLNASGTTKVSAVWPAGIPAGEDFFFQVWIADDGATRKMSATNALQAFTK